MKEEIIEIIKDNIDPYDMGISLGPNADLPEDFIMDESDIRIIATKILQLIKDKQVFKFPTFP